MGAEGFVHGMKRSSMLRNATERLTTTLGMFFLWGYSPRIMFSIKLGIAYRFTP